MSKEQFWDCLPGSGSVMGKSFLSAGSRALCPDPWKSHNRLARKALLYLLYLQGDCVAVGLSPVLLGP